jgi:hypothetical protein
VYQLLDKQQVTTFCNPTDRRTSTYSGYTLDDRNGKTNQISAYEIHHRRSWMEEYFSCTLVHIEYPFQAGDLQFKREDNIFPL